MVRAASANVVMHPSNAPMPDAHSGSPRSMAHVVGRYFDTVPFALCILDRARHVVFVNAEMARIVERTVAELDGYCITALFPEFGPVLEERYARAERGKPLPDFRIAWRGSVYILAFSATYDWDGRLAEILICAADVTREARIETRLRQSRRRLIQSLRIDHLTGLLNRKGLECAIRQELRRSNRDGSTVALLIIDIDCFKAYNDRFGHVAGDDCLMAIGHQIGQCGRRGGDAIGRYGGEEFIIVLGNTDEVGAMRVAERCRSSIKALGIDHPDTPTGNVTVSIGVTVMAGQHDRKIDGDAIAQLIATADKALYQAKKQGRNSVRLH